MCVMYTLHEHRFVRQQSNVWMMIPKRVTVAAAVILMPKLRE